MVLALMLTLIYGRSFSITRTFTGGAGPCNICIPTNSYNFNDANNWDPFGTPTSADDIIIPDLNGIYPTINSGQIASCRQLILEPGSWLASFGELDIYAGITNNTSSNVFYQNISSIWRLKCDVNTPLVSHFSGNSDFFSIEIERSCVSGGYGEILIAQNTTITISKYLDLTDAWINATQGKVILTLDKNYQEAAVLNKGLITGNCVVQVPVEGEERYHYLGNPINQDKPYQDLDAWWNHSPASEIDFAYFDAAGVPGNAFGHPQFNSTYQHPVSISGTPYGSTLNNPVPHYNCDPFPQQSDYTVNSQYVQDVNICAYSIITRTPYFMWYDESVMDPLRSTDAAFAYGHRGINPGVTTIDPIQGYVCHFGPAPARRLNGNGNGYIDWEGTVNDGPLTSDFTRNAAATDDDLYQTGTALIGNPYPSPVSLRRFFDSNSDKLESTISVFDGTLGEHAGTGVWTALDMSDPNTEYILPTGSAFFARVINEGTTTLSFSNRHRVPYTPTTRILRKAQPQNQIVLRIKTGKTNIDQTRIIIDSQASFGLEDKKDLLKTTGMGNVICTQKEGKPLDLCHLPYPKDFTEIPLRVELSESGTAELSLAASTYEFAGNPVYLNDKKANKLMLINEGFKYTYQPSASDGNKRFALIFNPDVSTTNKNNKPLKLTANRAAGRVNLGLNLDLNGSAKIRVMDMQGRLVKDENVDFQQGQATLITTGLKAGAYLFTVESGDQTSAPARALLY